MHFLGQTVDDAAFRSPVSGKEIGENRRGEPAPPGERACRRCGCWEWDPCWTEQRGACWWAQVDLCAFCAEGSDP